LENEELSGLANQEAQRFNHEYIAPEHVLISLVREGSGVAATVLREAGVGSRELRVEVEKWTPPQPQMITMGKLPQTPAMKKVLQDSVEEARNMGDAFVGTQHLLLAIVSAKDTVTDQVLTALSLKPDEIYKAIQVQLGARKDQPTRPKKSKTPSLDSFTRDITELARKQKLRPVVGRSAELNRLTTILSKLDRRSALLIGEAGSGRRSIVHGLAQRIADNTIVTKLAETRIVELDQGLLVAGTQYRGQFEERMTALVNEMRRAKNIILFAPQIHTLGHLGIIEESGLSGFELLKFAMARNEIGCIGTCTSKEYEDRVSIDQDFARCFQRMKISPPSHWQAIEILQGIKAHFEDHHKVEISGEAIAAAVELSELYMPDLPLPDKAINLIDEAGAHVSGAGSESNNSAAGKVCQREIVRLVSLETGISEADVADRQNAPG